MAAVGAAETIRAVHGLRHVRSRIVLLIARNKARKALQSFVSKDAAIESLRGAARREDGHRAFLTLGGAGSVSALRRNGSSLRSKDLPRPCRSIRR
jgi:hypothetical protein